jgi:hypothetical protein
MKDRYTQDNFKYIQATAKLLNARKRPSLLPKMDITWAFDSISWPFIIEIMQHAGFPNAWINWASILLSSASTRIMLNGVLREKICNVRGWRQSDPLSLMLFLLVNEALNGLFHKADA